jgi:hypothetical protein
VKLYNDCIWLLCVPDHHHHHLVLLLFLISHTPNVKIFYFFSSSLQWIAIVISPDHTFIINKSPLFSPLWLALLLLFIIFHFHFYLSPRQLFLFFFLFSFFSAFRCFNLWPCFVYTAYKYHCAYYELRH